MSPSSFTSKPYRKYLVIFLLLISSTCATPAAAQNWLWARTASSGAGIAYGGSAAFSTTTDLNSNIYVTGYFASDSISFGAITLTNTGTNDMYLVKYDSLGNVLWARNSGGNMCDDVGISVYTDASGNVYVTGYFNSSTISFDSITLNNAGSGNMFLVKYDANGNAKWAISAKGTGNDRASATTTDIRGNIYMVGCFTSPTLTIGASTLNSVDGVNNNMVIVKFDSTGNVLWAKSAGINGSNVGANAVRTDSFGNVYVGGYFSGGSLSFGTTTLINGDIYLVKYNSLGNVVWAKSAGSGNDNIPSISTDPSNNIYVTGWFKGANITFGTFTLSNPGLFLVKYDSSGNVLWVQTAEGGGEGYSVITDAIGSVYITGTIGLDSTVFGSTTLYSRVSDIFLVKYNPAGSVEYSISADGDDCLPWSITNDAIGSLYLTGFFTNDSVVFGTTTLINTDIPITTNSTAMFLAKLSSTLGVPIINPNKNNIVLYPNPNNGQMTVMFSKIGYSNVVVYDCLGRQVYTTSLTGSEKTVALDLSYMPPGVYFLKATGEGKSESMPFVVKNNS